MTIRNPEQSGFRMSTVYGPFQVYTTSPPPPNPPPKNQHLMWMPQLYTTCLRRRWLSTFTCFLDKTSASFHSYFRSQGKRSFLSPSHESGSPRPEPDQIQIKTEKKEADPKIFLGPDNIHPDKNPFLPKDLALPEDVSRNVKTRLESVSNLFEKIKKLSSEKSGLGLFDY
jgi:hypothetical protein